MTKAPKLKLSLHKSCMKHEPTAHSATVLFTTECSIATTTIGMGTATGMEHRAPHPTPPSERGKFPTGNQGWQSD